MLRAAPELVFACATSPFLLIRHRALSSARRTGPSPPSGCGWRWRRGCAPALHAHTAGRPSPGGREAAAPLPGPSGAGAGRADPGPSAPSGTQPSRVPRGSRNSASAPVHDVLTRPDDAHCHQWSQRVARPRTTRTSRRLIPKPRVAGSTPVSRSTHKGRTSSSFRLGTQAPLSVKGARTARARLARAWMPSAAPMVLDSPRNVPNSGLRSKGPGTPVAATRTDVPPVPVSSPHLGVRARRGGGPLALDGPVPVPTSRTLRRL